MFTFERLRASLSTQSGKKFLATAFVALFVVIGITASLHGVNAQPVPTTPSPTVTTPPPTTPAAADPGSGACGEQPLSTVCGWIATLLGLFADFIGRLILLVLSVLIAFAQYNDFGKAIPVNEGWVVVRDTTNMFFIVILLLTAFATVIGRDEFHYSKILPKLLLQAVLINFSKTLILLAVDFSQVVMLTFVNAFAQSAAGNFVYALGLDKMMQLGANISGIDVGKIIIAYFLAISFMIIALGVTIILTGYLIYRIVALWVTIIIAPLAFFATAVPDKFKASIGAIGQEYWKRLTNLLTAGPVIAFFLWLTLAVTQKSNEASNAASVDTVASGQGLATALNLVRPESAGQQSVLAGATDNAVGATFGFLNQIADSAHIASFIVGITMMLMALDTAVASAAAMGGFAAYIGKKTKSFAKGVALAPTVGLANQIDKRLDITGKASRVGLATLGRVPVLKGMVRPTLQKGLVYRRKEADAEAQEAMKGAMEVRKYASLKEGLEYGKTFSAFANPISTLGRRASSQKISELFGSNEVRDLIAKRTKEDNIKNVTKAAADKGIIMSSSDIKSGSEIIAQRDARRSQAVEFQNQMQMAKSRGDRDGVEKLEQMLKINPGLAAEVGFLNSPAGLNPARSLKDTQEAMAKQYDGLATSPDKYKDVDEFTAGSGMLATSLMLKNGWEADKDGKLTKVDDAAWDRKVLEMGVANKKIAEAMVAADEYVKNSPGATVSDMANIQIKKNAADGSMQYYAIDDRGGKPGSNAGVRVRSVNQQTAIDGMKTAVTSGGAPTQAQFTEAISNGVSLKEIIQNIDGDKKPQNIASFAGEIVGNETTAAAAFIDRAISEERDIKSASSTAKTNVEQMKASVAKAKKTVDSERKNSRGMPSLDLDAAEAEYAKAQADLQAAKDTFETDKETSKQRINAVYAKATSDAIVAMRNAIKMIEQIDTEGISETAQLEIIAKAQEAGIMKMYENIDKLPQNISAPLIKLAPIIAKRSENSRIIQSQGGVVTKAQEKTVQLADDMRVIAASKPPSSAWRKMF